MRAILFASVLLFPFSAASAQGQAVDLQAQLGIHVNQYSLSASSLADAVLKVGKRFELPVGIEWVRDKGTMREVSLVWTDATVGSMIGSVIKRYPPYTFRVENGIVHVFRPDLIGDSHNFLNLKVPGSFAVRQETGGFADVQLRDVVQNTVSPRNLPPGAGEGGSYTSGNVPERPLTLALGGLTVREALDKLADASEHKMWVVTFADSSELTPTGFRRTETLWHPTPFPEHDQPMWDFLAWEQYQPRATPMPPPPPH